VPTLPWKLPQMLKHVKCNAFSSVDCEWLWKKPVFVVGWLWKESIVYSICSKWSHMHAVMFSIDKRPCRRCSAECSGDAITVMWKTHHLCHFTSEQNKVSKVSSWESYTCSWFLNVCWERERESRFLTAHQHKNRPFSAIRGKNVCWWRAKNYF